MAKKTNNLVRLKDVQARLILPGKKDPISSSALHLTHLPALGIVPVNALGKPKAAQKEESFITEEQAAAIERRFKEIHWRKFKTAG